MPEPIQPSEEMINPIDPDSVTETPGTLSYGHHRGSALVKPEDMGKVMGKAMLAMEQQVDMQYAQLREQIETLANQARRLQRRKEVSDQIYQAQIGFEPIINHVYYLYVRKNGQRMLSMLSPVEWGRSMPFETCEATVRLLADHTWDVLE